MMTENLTPEERTQGLLASVDQEAAAATRDGYSLVAYGIVMRDGYGRLCWFNRAHRDFAEAVTSVEAFTVAFVGLTEGEQHYLHMSYGHETTTEADQVKGFVRTMLERIGAPSKDILWFTEEQ
jgi:hypothetical protein